MKNEEKKIIIIILVAIVLGVLIFDRIHFRNQTRVVERYLEQNRPNVIAAIEAYKTDFGSYPDSITNAIPHYYKGPQDRIFFLERYEYRSLGTNFYLRHF